MLRILSLNGGGIKGAFSAWVLATWKMTPDEKSVKTPFLFGLAAAPLVATHPVSA